MANDVEVQDSVNTEEDKTSTNDEAPVSNDAELQKKIQTLDAQRQNWKDKAVDPTTGKTYKELFESSKKEDKTSKNDEPVQPQSNNSDLLEKFDKLALKTEGITDDDEVELANKLKKETGKDMEDLLSSKYFQTELESLREGKANVAATSDVQGGSGASEAKMSPEYWLAKGEPPTKEDVPDRKTRAKIARAFMANAKSSKTFYND